MAVRRSAWKIVPIVARPAIEAHNGAGKAAARMHDVHTHYSRSWTPLRASAADRAPDAAVDPQILVSVGKHDDHSLEIKTVTEYGRGRGLSLHTEAYIFMPKSVHLSSWTRDELANDFHGHVRFSVPFLSDHGRGVVEAARNRFEDARRAWEKTAPLAEDLLTSERREGVELVSAGRHMAAVMAEVLKGYEGAHKRRLKEAAKATDPHTAAAKLCSLRASLVELHRILGSLRISWVPLASRDVAGEASFFSLLDEYTSQLFVGYLASLEGQLQRRRAAFVSQEMPMAGELAALTAEINAIRCGEATYQRERIARDEEFNEEVTARLSQLKKFFQAPLHLQVNEKKGQGRITEPAAVLGATLAAGAAYIVEVAQGPSSTHIASQSAFVMSFGIFLYVLKDRLKDRLRNDLLKRAERFLPDLERVLMSSGHRIGVVRSWLRASSREQVPSEVRERRCAAALTGLERAIPEDVLIYRERLIINEEAGGSGPMACLRSGLRVNLERYLRYFDDPYKSFYSLSSNGSLKSREAHRVYHFYLCVRTGVSPNRTLTEGAKASIYRIVLDKQGINRVERVKTPR